MRADVVLSPAGPARPGSCHAAAGGRCDVEPRHRARRRAGGHCAARSRTASSGRPIPSSATVRTSSRALTTTLDLGALGEGVPRDVARSPRAAPAAAGRGRPGTAVSIGPVVRTDGREAQDRHVLRAPARGSRLAATSACRFWSSKIVPRIALIVSSRSSTDPRAGATTLGADHQADPLELQAGGEQPLDHHVVEVAGDPLPVGDHGELLAVGHRLGAVQRQGGLVGEGGEQLAVPPARAGRSPGRTARPARPPEPGGPAASTTTTRPSI